MRQKGSRTSGSNLLAKGYSHFLDAMLNKKLIGTIVGISGVSVLAYLFYRGYVNLPEYATQLAVGISLSLFAVGYWTFKDDIDRRLGKETKPKSGFLLLEDGHGSNEEKLDDLIKEIDSFVREWKRYMGFKIGYRKQIQRREIYGDIKKIGEAAQRLQHKIKALNNIQNPNLVTSLTSLRQIVDRIIYLGSDVEKTFRFLKIRQAMKIPDVTIDQLILSGDQICVDLKIIQTELQKVRIELI